jgi:hypothetical protein
MLPIKTVSVIYISDALTIYSRFIIIIIIIIITIISGVGLSPLGIAAISGLLYKPQMVDEGDCGAIGGMKIGRGNRSTRRKPAPAPLCPPQFTVDSVTSHRVTTSGCY